MNHSNFLSITIFIVKHSLDFERIFCIKPHNLEFCQKCQSLKASSLKTYNVRIESAMWVLHNMFSTHSVAHKFHHKTNLHLDEIVSVYNLYGQLHDITIVLPTLHIVSREAEGRYCSSKISVENQKGAITVRSLWQ